MIKTENNTTSNSEMITISRAEYEKLQRKEGYVVSLESEVQQLRQLLKLARHKQFGASSERASEEVMEQLSLLFDEAEAYEQPKEEENPPTQDVKAHKRKKSGAVKDIIPEGTPKDVVEHRLSEDERICPCCNTQMEEIGKEVRSTLKIIPAQVRVQEDHYFSYACKCCEKEGTETPIATAFKDRAVISGSFASPEAVAHIMTQKFVMGSPLYRQEQELNRQGVMLSRQTMSNWILRCTKDWLTPVYEELHRQLVSQDVLHADETSLQVLREPGKKAQSKSYMWLYRTSGNAEHPIVLYEYQPDRKDEHPKEFLAGFEGYLHSDGYVAYHNLPETVTSVGCWAHARRYFDEAVKSLPKGKQSGGTAVMGQAYCTKLFKIEQTLADLTPEERYKKRLKQAEPVLNELFAWAKTRAATPKSALGKALGYLRSQEIYLRAYLKDSRLELSNNRAERSIKPFVIGRKNFLFANTPEGAQGSAVMYSLIETAKENGLDPYRYLVYVLKTAPSLDQTTENWTAPLLPQNAPDDCSVPQKERTK